jgi:hypothetical protein
MKKILLLLILISSFAFSETCYYGSVAGYTGATAYLKQRDPHYVGHSVSSSNVWTYYVWHRNSYTCGTTPPASNNCINGTFTNGQGIVYNCENGQVYLENSTYNPETGETSCNSGYSMTGASLGIPACMPNPENGTWDDDDNIQCNQHYHKNEDGSGCVLDDGWNDIPIDVDTGTSNGDGGIGGTGDNSGNSSGSGTGTGGTSTDSGSGTGTGGTSTDSGSGTGGTSGGSTDSGSGSVTGTGGTSTDSGSGTGGTSGGSTDSGSGSGTGTGGTSTDSGSGTGGTTGGGTATGGTGTGSGTGGTTGGGTGTSGGTDGNGTDLGGVISAINKNTSENTKALEKLNESLNNTDSTLTDDLSSKYSKNDSDFLNFYNDMKSSYDNFNSQFDTAKGIFENGFEFTPIYAVNNPNLKECLTIKVFGKHEVLFDFITPLNYIKPIFTLIIQLFMLVEVVRMCFKIINYARGLF